MKELQIVLFALCVGAFLGCESSSAGVDSLPSGETGSESEEGPFTDETGAECETLSPCGDCDPECRRESFDASSGAPQPGDPVTTWSGVIDHDEGVTVDVQSTESHFIWIANSGEGTVSKIDTRTYEEVGRYLSGPDGTDNDPSRTSVNGHGDVFVGNRQGLSVSKISGAGQNCPDTNGDGSVTTSTGPDDVLPWGMDDCVLWSTRLPDADLIRAVAAQDVNSHDDTLRPSVWVGGWNGEIWRLHSDNGRIMFKTASPVRPYGFALDKAGNLWISSRENAFGRLDTRHCFDAASCDVEICDETGDACLKQRIPIDATPYGITVDVKQRVWLGGDALIRYDRTAAPGSRLEYVRGSGQSIWIHGIQADLEGSIWGAAHGTGVLRFDADNPQDYVEVVDSDASSKGIAVDLDGKVWSINIDAEDATVIVPGQQVADNDIIQNVSGFVWPYTYSDMTGSQLSFATDQTGFVRRTFAGCPNTVGTDWSELRWDAEVPPDTSIRFFARGAATVDELSGLDWHLVAEVPPQTSPIDLAAQLAAAGVGATRYLQVEAQLTAIRAPDQSTRAPTLKTMEVTYHCGPRGGTGFPEEGQCVAAYESCEIDAHCCSKRCVGGTCIEN